jgi:hypothetical protein
MKRIVCVVLGSLLAFSVAAPLSAQCYVSYGSTENAKRNKLFLYFPTADDATFPDIDPAPDINTSPARAFNIADLDSSIGTVAALRDAIRDIVVSDYCEFNVQVIETTSNPDSMASPPDRRVTVALGSDGQTVTDPITGNTGNLFGTSEPSPSNPSSPDVGNARLIDHARVWAGSYLATAGPGAGGELAGADSTLARWATAIGGTAAHEAGHTFGLQHGDDVTPRATEDVRTRHIMPKGQLLTNEQRVGFRRHFSDITFGVLAANVGLSVQTVHNWDYTNPNNVDARRLQMEILSTASSLTLGWAYTGPRSPWTTPAVVPIAGTVTFVGVTYNRFTVTWSAGQSWSESDGAPGQPSGVVGPGLKFHVGAEFVGVDFNTPNPIIIRDVVLQDSSGNPLTLHPRMAAYDAGTLDVHDGNFRIEMLNPDPARPLELRNIVVRELPRVLAIESMLSGRPLLTWDGQPVLPWREKTLPDVVLRDTVSLDIASLEQGHNVFINHDHEPNRPRPGKVGAARDTNGPRETNDDDRGIDVDLFPATTVYVTMTVVDPDAEHWDRAAGRMVRGPVESQLFYQFRGITPDLNHNGKDDFIDVATGVSTDTNGNGIPDEVDRRGKRWTLYGFTGPFHFDHALSLDNGIVYGLRLSKRSGNVAWEGEAGISPTNDFEGESGNVIQGSVNGRWFFGGASALQPFLIGGAGLLRFDSFAANDTAPAINAGVGLELPLGASLRLRFDARDFVAFGAYNAGTTHNRQYTIGLGF